MDIITTVVPNVKFWQSTQKAIVRDLYNLHMINILNLASKLKHDNIGFVQEI